MNLRKVLRWGSFSAIVAASSVATAGPKDEKAVAPKVNAKAVEKDLASGDSASIETAFINIKHAGKEGGGRAFVSAIVAKLKSGLSRMLTIKALETLGDLEDPASSEAGEMYMQHRDPEVRLAAVRCLGGAKTPGAIKALRVALGDPDPRVHSMAATVLGNMKAQDALPDLVVALDKGVTSAASSIGMLCDNKACDVLLDRLKSKPFDVISSGLSAVLGRAAISDDEKRKVIAAVKDLASQKAREFLEEVRKAWPANGSKAIAMELDMAVKALEGASK
jgi:HEAT repeats